MTYRFLYSIFVLASLVSCKTDTKQSVEAKDEIKVAASDNPLIYPEEKHFKSIRQVTFGGDNAEAYWSFDDKQIVFQ